MIIETNELECHQDSPTVGVKLGDGKLVETEDLRVEWVSGKSKACLQLLLIHYNRIFSRNMLISLNIFMRSLHSKNVSRDMISIIQMLYVFPY